MEDTLLCAEPKLGKSHAAETFISLNKEMGAGDYPKRISVSFRFHWIHLKIECIVRN